MEIYRLAAYYCIIVNSGAGQGSDAGSVGVYASIQAMLNCEKFNIVLWILIRLNLSPRGSRKPFEPKVGDS